MNYKPEWKYLTNICLNITNSCNLKCKYCFVEQKSEFIKLETAIQIINYLHKNLLIKRNKFNYPKDYKCRVTFFGGEPTLLFNEIIIPLVNYIESNFKNDFILSITTNGTLLNKSKILFLKNHNIDVLLSLDGDKYTQDFNRPMKNNKSSFDQIMKILPILQHYFPNLTMRATIDQDTVDQLFNNYLFAIQHNFTSVDFVPNERQKWKEQNLEILKLEIKKIFIFNINYFLKNKKFPINYGFMNSMLIDILQYHDNPIKFHNSNILERCGLGTINASIDYAGNILACQEQDSKISEENIFYIGDIIHGINLKRHKQLLQLFLYNQNTNICENPKLCFNCNYKQLCKELICPSVTYDLFNNFSTMTIIHCIYFQSLYLNIMALLNIINNTKYKEDFIQYILNIEKRCCF